MTNCKEWQIAKGIELQRRDGLYFVNGLPWEKWRDSLTIDDDKCVWRISHIIFDDYEQLQRAQIRESRTTIELNG